MLYDAYDMQRSLLAGASAFADLGAEWMNNPVNPLSYTQVGHMMGSGLDVFAHATAPRGKPAFGLETTMVGDRLVRVHEEDVVTLPFGNLKHFVREGVEGGEKLLIVAPMSGHFATLLRGTVERMLPCHDVYITDWADAKMVPLSQGHFSLDSYVDYLIQFLEHIGPGAHMLAVCQPSVPCYAAAAVMSADQHPCRPRTLTMMGGPIDTRQAPTEVNTVATQRPFSWFEQNVIQTVPFYHPGGGRKVYPGWLQLTGFMAMNLGNHMISHWTMFKHLVTGADESADATKAFYEEYRSVCDMDSRFYLETIDVVFQAHALPRGLMTYHGRKVDPADITDIGLLAIEGENDDISGIGQTKAALDIATSLAPARKKYLLAQGVGHYGIFNGRKWREQIAPVVERWIAKYAAA